MNYPHNPLGDLAGKVQNLLGEYRSEQTMNTIIMKGH